MSSSFIDVALLISRNKEEKEIIFVSVTIFHIWRIHYLKNIDKKSEINRIELGVSH